MPLPCCCHAVAIPSASIALPLRKCDDGSEMGRAPGTQPGMVITDSAPTTRFAAMRVDVYVRPGASKTWVGGEFSNALVIHVKEPATKGRATAAAIRALSDALGLPASALRLVRGITSKAKLIEIEVPDASITEITASLTRLHAQVTAPRSR